MGTGETRNKNKHGCGGTLPNQPYTPQTAICYFVRASTALLSGEAVALASLLLHDLHGRGPGEYPVTLEVRAQSTLRGIPRDPRRRMCPPQCLIPMSLGTAGRWVSPAGAQVAEWSCSDCAEAIGIALYQLPCRLASYDGTCTEEWALEAVS